MNVSKRFVSFVLAMVLCIGFVVPAYAATPPEDATDVSESEFAVEPLIVMYIPGKTLRPRHHIQLRCLVFDPKDPGNGHVVKWQSSNNRVATVSNRGRVTAKTEGTAIISAVGSNGLTGTSVITVDKKGIEVTGIRINHLMVTVKRGSKIKLKALVYPENATDRKVIWWSSGNPEIATVQQNGVVIAKNPGSIAINVTARDGGKGHTCIVTVKDNVAGVSLNRTAFTLKRGKAMTLKAAVKPENAFNRQVIWYSSNKDVATVSSRGVVRAQGKGTCYITAVTKDGGYKARCKITVR